MATNLSIDQTKYLEVKDLNFYIDNLFLSVTMTLRGRTSKMAFVLMAIMYFVTGQIIPGVA